ncbi:hypothetical protein Nepgr_011334 [Nepenthes gracilis]|uniref:Uncharacterized protein n=1 Tax=Nepenthes gracilis TaxID=150966 RepID=A0AAD3XLV5_NEPGR|nr:hypothetical protein Nepgr_011334 [Nepenthes gracilis]
MKLVWSPETASKAYIDTVKACELYRESGVAELISATAAGWNAKLIVETWTQGGALTTSIGLAIASRHACGLHVCIVPDESSRSEYAQAMSEAGLSPEVIVGDAEKVMVESSLVDGIDFLVVDCRGRDFARPLTLAKLSQRGAVLVCKNASSRSASSFRWRSVLDGGYRLVRTAFLPVGNGLDIAHVAAPNGGGAVHGATSVKRGRRWFKHVDQNSGEEHVIRT